MNPSEFLAMLDDRLSDGRRYPTLDQYTQALADVRERERRAERERRHIPDLTPAVQSLAAQHQARATYEAMRGQAAAPVADWFDRHKPATGWWSIQAWMAGAWQTVGQGRQFSAFRTPEAARDIVRRMRSVQGHVPFRLFNDQTGEVIEA